ncbi:MAG: flagellar basal body L-ring protein FlgH [Hyphomonadaceae bacterium]
MNQTSFLRSVALAALAVGATACASAEPVASFTQDAMAAPGAAYDAARRSMAPPQLNPVADPTQLTGEAYQSLPQAQAAAYAPAAPNSLWREGRRSFFNDQRAGRIGDILTVEIEIDDSAQLSNSSNRTREGSTSVGVGNFFGLEAGLGRIFGAEFDNDNLISADAESEQRGQGAINRQEKIELTVAAVIVDRLPNGNLVIAGRQEVRINAELRELTVSGVIRPEDIDANNTISQEQIAEARVSYGGRGQLSAVQRPNWGQRIGDAVTPW